MRLLHLSLVNYRNFARLDIAVPPGATLIIGPNAQGKTSLLEAIYYLATFTAFQTRSDRELIRFAALNEPLAVARIQAEFQRQGRTQYLEVRIIREPNHTLNGRIRKEVLLNGVKVRLVDAVGQLTAVLFLPAMVEVLTGAPEVRRRFFNLTLAQAIPSYAAQLSEYNRLVTQRNALLRQLQERPQSLQVLDPWDEQLSQVGARLMYARIQALAELERLARRIHDRLTHGREILHLVYQPAYEPLSPPPNQPPLPLTTPVDRTELSVKELATGFHQALIQRRAEDLARGMSTLGPHRDEIRLLSNGVDLGTYGSRGQLRTALLSLKLAEAQWLAQRTQEPPILLLDEVLAELDADRRRLLLEHLEAYEQSLLTTTDLRLFATDFLQRATRWYLREGMVERVEPPGG